MNQLHAAKIKRKFPTMAGVIGLVAVGAITLALNLSRAQTFLPLAAFLGGGLVGMIDDIINLSGRSATRGLRAPVKFVMISILGLALGWFFWNKLGWTGINIPFNGSWDIGWAIIPVFAFAVVATSNAVNITDGLDGLAGGLAMIAYGTFGMIALMQGQVGVAGFCFTIMGWLLSYTWFNVAPARFMMGDTGSFALGAGLGVVAMMTNTFFLLPIIGFLFVLETSTSLLQIIYKKFLKRKLFVSAPLHHHLEAKGWPESKVTMRFWILGGVGGISALFIAIAGGMV